MISLYIFTHDEVRSPDRVIIVFMGLGVYSQRVKGGREKGRIPFWIWNFFWVFTFYIFAYGIMKVRVKLILNKQVCTLILTYTPASESGKAMDHC